MIIECPGYSPFIKFRYYVQFEEILNREVNEAQDFTVEIPFTDFAKEAVTNASKVYVITSDLTCHKMKKHKLKGLKKSCELHRTVIVENQEQWGLTRVRTTSLLARLLLGKEVSDYGTDFIERPDK